MENESLSKHTITFGISLALCSVLNAVLVVCKEKIPAVATAMKQMTGHHWVTHSALIVLLFAISGWSLARLNGGKGPRLSANRLISIVVGGGLTGGVIIMGFYLLAD